MPLGAGFCWLGSSLMPISSTWQSTLMNTYLSAFYLSHATEDPGLGMNQNHHHLSQWTYMWDTQRETWEPEAVTPGASIPWEGAPVSWSLPSCNVYHCIILTSLWSHIISAWESSSHHQHQYQPSVILSRGARISGQTGAGRVQLKISTKLADSNN